MECNYTIYSFQELSSTNTYAKEQLSFLPDRCVITADCQTAGKGRMGKNWSSPPGLALYLTFVLKNPPFDISMLPLISALAVCRALEHVTEGLDLQIKWPNDVLLRRKKLCGILCESVLKKNDCSVISGIGINVNQCSSDFASDALAYATSLLIETGKRFPIQEIRDALIQSFDEALEFYAAEGFSAFQREYERRLVNIGKEVRVLYREHEVQAVAVGILENGNLLCENEEGRFAVNSGEASVRGLYGYT
ncbi:biotin--[acetyl-CoA-carboxylase] ligase [Massiliimalia massiliensis]|uniref:biotin--[acetyl-CoA-carboxylase] ligase n=1 Tax=Massiliimalia massiliensis TaxID=1852384 RepID=UPI0009864534|nr:biotin--[acetyl-CoA-carboxylase] ligase [Massiliimalia massiliensis]MBS1473598.1 biotin--[acetyl-CoA-carboxylase] ligase [Massiliimalia sp.]